MSGMAGTDDDDDEFADDVLDNLGFDDIRELQEQAYSQVEQAVPINRPFGLYDLPQAPDRATLLTSDVKPTTSDAQYGHAAKTIGPAQPVGESEQTQREQWRQQRYGGAARPRLLETNGNAGVGSPSITLPHRGPQSSQEHDGSPENSRQNESSQNSVHANDNEILHNLKQQLEQVRPCILHRPRFH